jgi:hypothetical protein
MNVLADDDRQRSWDLPSRTTSTLVQSLELTLQRIELVIVELFELNELWPCSGSASDELIELQLQRSRVTVPFTGSLEHDSTAFC